jgi:hypothetical protein
VPGLIYSSFACGPILYFRMSPLCEGSKDSETPAAHAKLRATVPLGFFAQVVLVRWRLTAGARGTTVDTLSERKVRTCKTERSRTGARKVRRFMRS